MTGIEAASRSSATDAPARPRRRVKLSIATVLVTGFGSLMLAAVAGVLLLGLVSAGRNTLALLGDKAGLALSEVTVRVRHQLDPARDQAVFLSELIARGELDPADPQRMTDTFRGALAATPQVAGLGFIDPAFNTVRVGRRPEGVRAFAGNLRDLPAGHPIAAELPRLRSLIEEGRYRPYAFWADPVWDPEMNRTLLTVRAPVLRDGRYLGMVMVAVSLGDLSRFLSELYIDTGLNAAVLYDRSHVLAHPALTRLDFDFSGAVSEPPLPRIDQLDDPVLAGLWDTGGGFQLNDAGRTIPVTGRIVEVGGEGYLILFGGVPSYGSRSWTIAIMTPLAEVSAELRRLVFAAVAGLAILLLAVTLALLLGRAISRRIARLEAAAASLRDFDFGNAPLLPESRFRELDNAARAFNTMVRGLRWFETYVPKQLVLRLIRQGVQEGGLASEERAVTVMFTDIRGFSRMSQNFDAAQIATLLNRHFTLLAACIEAEGGTVDKYIGDAIMAFWGAPEAQPDHAARGLAAARAIAAALHGDNLLRAAAGEEPIRMRAALHSGPVVVGNIGSASRLNYTIVGDTVNTAARIEELAGTLQRDDEETLILASGAIVAAAGPAAGRVRSIGCRELRGRAGTVEVFRVETGQAVREEPREAGAAGARASVR